MRNPGRLALALSLSAAVLVGPARGQASGAEGSPPGVLPALAPAEVLVAETLRRARIEDDLAPAVYCETIAAGGLDVIAPCLKVLERRRVPPLEPGQVEQALSLPQRDIALAALGLLDPRPIRAAVEERLALATDLSGRVLALRVLGAIGDGRQIERLVELGLEEDEEQPARAAEEALRDALAAILRRDPPAFDRLQSTVRESPPTLHAALILGAADSGDPRALEILTHVLAFRPELAPLAAAQVRRVGRSPSATVNRELAGRLRWLLDPGQPELCRAVLLALGELHDFESIPTLIELLEHGDRGLAQNALWALQRMTGLRFPSYPERWRSWYETEQGWFAHEERAVLRRLVSRDPADVAAALREISMRRIWREELAVEVLVALEHSNPALRVQACEVLAALGAEVAVPALVDCLDDDVPSCTLAAGRALVAITGRQLPAEAQAWRAALALGS